MKSVLFVEQIKGVTTWLELSDSPPKVENTPEDTAFPTKTLSLASFVVSTRESPASAKGVKKHTGTYSLHSN